MRDEDEVFADIVKQEFDEQWTPPAPATQPPPPLPDFHLNLYDDDESYRQVPAQPKLSVATRWGIALIGLGLLIAISRFTPWSLPVWLGWVAIGCFVAGMSVCLWHVTHRPRTDDDDEGVV